MDAPVSVAPRSDVEFERVWLDDRSWVDVARGWLDGADDVCAALLEQVSWRQGRHWRYERWVEEPRLGGWWGVGDAPPHPVLPQLQRDLQHRYRVSFDGAALARYRDGRDSVAFHRDREMRWLDDTVIAVLSLGQRRPWVLRPRTKKFDHVSPNGGATHDISPASGDLLVMGGRCQADWEHSVPKVRHPIGDRVSLQWRWTSRRGRPERGASWRAPLNYSG
ncbi:MAG: putative alkylated repair protein [Acidimicrobiales bacterium]|nr:putative alkylated repair protein [Acidimicrobiales bacterium]